MHEQPGTPWYRNPHYVHETVTIALDDEDLATTRVGVGVGTVFAVCEIMEVGDVGSEVREYTKQIERRCSRGSERT